MKRFFRSKVGLGLLIAAATALGTFGYHQASAAFISDCTANSIIKCGEPNPTTFINKVKSNNPADLQAVYSDFGLVPSQYTKFATHAVGGVANQDGTIVVNGQTVATNAFSIGRSSKSYSTPMNIAGHTYFRSPATKVLKQNLPVMVLFNDQGVMQFAVMNACGNPTTGNKIVPKFSCDLLQKTPVSGQANTFSFTTKATATNNAKLAKVVYDFGDGSPTVTKTSLSTPVTHTYATPGTFTAKVTVFVSLPGDQQQAVTSANCETQITVQAPPQVSFTCDSLEAIPNKDNDLEFTFQANTSSQNATLTSADFDFGDGMTAPDVAPTSATMVSTDHTFAKPGNFTIQATVHFQVTDQSGQTSVKSVNCSTQVNTQVCPTNANLPLHSPQCVAPVKKQLPNTGAGGVIGLFIGTSILGFAAYRYYLTRRFLRK